VVRLFAGRAALFLDRDGVINRSIVRDGRPFAPTRLDELEILPGVVDALRRARDAGLLNVVVTNQPDIATGKQDRQMLEAMHGRLMSELALDSIKVCGHVDADDCMCRKPRPGLLLEAARELNIDLAASFIVGDRWRDVGAGQRAGCRALFIDHGYDERRPEPPYQSVESLADAVDFVVSGPWANFNAERI
jgi:D-glycero-D-manno-heptose 1,7-bisphosphate phosphatase